MRMIFFGAVFCACVSVIPLAAVADTTIFPPSNELDCTKTGAQFLGWFNGAPGTFCATGQDVMHNALKGVCKNGQYVAKEGGEFICKDIPVPPVCDDDEMLAFDGEQFECKEKSARCSNDSPNGSCGGDGCPSGTAHYSYSAGDGGNDCRVSLCIDGNWATFGTACNDDPEVPVSDGGPSDGTFTSPPTGKKPPAKAKKGK